MPQQDRVREVRVPGRASDCKDRAFLQLDGTQASLLVGPDDDSLDQMMVGVKDSLQPNRLEPMGEPEYVEHGEGKPADFGLRDRPLVACRGHAPRSSCSRPNTEFTCERQSLAPRSSGATRCWTARSFERSILLQILDVALEVVCDLLEDARQEGHHVVKGRLIGRGSAMVVPQVVENRVPLRSRNLRH